MRMMTRLGQLSLVWRTAGSPADRLFRRLGGRGGPWWRGAVVVALLAWLPPQIASLVGRLHELRFADWIEAHASAYLRFLVALPLAIIVQPFVDRRLSFAIQYLQRDGVFLTADEPRIEAAMATLRRRRESGMNEIGILILAYVAAAQSPKGALSLGSTGHLHGPTAEAFAAIWTAFVSLPLLFFVLLRWCFRIIAWWVFLANLARRRLRLLPAHPDRAGGLGVVALAQASLGAVGFVFSTAWSAGWYERFITERSAAFATFRTGLAAYAVLAAILMWGPLVAFAFKLNAARNNALLRYGHFASRYIRAFEQKWISGSKEDPGELLGTSDIQSLSDLQHAYATIVSMRPLPYDRTTLVALLVGTALPILPVVAVFVPISSLAALVFRPFL